MSSTPGSPHMLPSSDSSYTREDFALDIAEHKAECAYDDLKEVYSEYESFEIPDSESFLEDVMDIMDEITDTSIDITPSPILSDSEELTPRFSAIITYCSPLIPAEEFPVFNISEDDWYLSADDMISAEDLGYHAFARGLDKRTQKMAPMPLTFFGSPIYHGKRVPNSEATFTSTTRISYGTFDAIAEKSLAAPPNTPRAPSFMLHDAQAIDDEDGILAASTSTLKNVFWTFSSALKNRVSKMAQWVWGERTVAESSQAL